MKCWCFLTTSSNLSNFLILFFLLCFIFITNGDSSIFVKGHAVRHRQHINSNSINHQTNEEPLSPPLPPYILNNRNFSSTNNNNIKEVLAKPKEDVQLNCELGILTNISTKYIKWYHNGFEIDFVHRYVAKDGNAGQLIINHIRLEDSGIWNCQNKIAGVIGNPISVVVLDEPRTPYLLIDGRRLDPGNLFLPIKENNDITVQCIAEGGNPAPKLKWVLTPSSGLIYNADIILNSATSMMIPGLQILNETATAGVNSGSVVRSEAKLTPVIRAHHNATISCILTHVTLPQPLNASILLDVEYTPSFGISRVPGFGFPVTEGIPVSLKCDVDSNPSSNPIWQKDNRAPPVEQSADGFLNFSAIQISDSGWYKCITRYQSIEYSSIGYFLNVREPNNQLETDMPEELIEEGSAVEVTLGGEIQLECPAGSISCWGRSKTPGQNLEPLGPGPKLTLDNVVYQEAGEYKCFVGRSSKMEKWRSRSVQVNVMGAPVIYPGNKTITVVTGQRVTFSLEFCANPPVTKSFWIRGLKSLPPGTILNDMIAHNISESNTRHCQKAELTINSVQIDHGGEYIFIVASEKGMTGSTIILNVTVTKTLIGDQSEKVAAQNSAFFSVLLKLNNCLLFFLITVSHSIMYFIFNR